MYSTQKKIHKCPISTKICTLLNHIISHRHFSYLIKKNSSIFHGDNENTELHIIKIICYCHSCL